MSDNNRNLRIRVNTSTSESNIPFKLEQDIDNIEILSLNLSTSNFYKYHNSDYGCVVGRVIANGGIGVPNARISLFVRADDNWLDENILSDLYPYTSVATKNENGIRYNTLPEEVVSQCHTPVGTMPSKRMLLDDDNILEVYENFYKFTTVSNNAGDYMLFGIPTGDQIIHMDLDLSDCGYLSQRPRDMMYKGYNIDMFENASKFKGGTNLDNLPQIISKNDSIYVYPFWGNEEEGNEAKITRNDITIDYEFVPTCVFIGSLVSDEGGNSISKRCIPAERMGQMDRLTAGNGRIEMIRKNANGAVEELQVQGTELIDGNGTWCYQIPMNLDYMKTDEYGNLVPSEDPSIGIATRTRVRFRISLNDYESDYAETHIAKVLVPNNPKTYEDLDYHFGSMAMDEEDGTKSFRDLFWNNVYTVKSYIPRIQKGNMNRNRRFSGFKAVNISEGKNQIPYNNMRLRFNFMYVLMCSVMKVLLWLMGVYNKRLLPFAYKMMKAGGFIAGFLTLGLSEIGGGVGGKKKDLRCLTVGDGVCPDLDGWYFAPKCTHDKLFKQTWDYLRNDLIDDSDKKSVDYLNSDIEEPLCLTNQIDYLMQCMEINLAQEYEVIKFDFYNDWINGLVYIPRWDARYRKKKSIFFGLIKRKAKTQACFDLLSNSPYTTKRRLTQQCALSYKKDDDGYYTEITTNVGCHKKRQKCHKRPGRDYLWVLGRLSYAKNGGGLCHVEETMKGEKVYYFKPCEFHKSYDGTYENRILMFATDIVLLGSLNECDENGIPMAFKELHSTSYLMPTNLAKTNMDSEGYMYAYGSTKESICTNKRIEKPVVALSGDSQTFSNFVTWSKTTDAYEKEPNDITEYAITEAAGIDWGWTGPNQGESNEDIPYYPGGHFLGISCVNAQTNIKSCVNLSRICEVGSTMSSRNHILLKNSNDTEFAYTQPTGLISKDELNDSQFRTMFATLNLNGLKTVIDEETNYRKYEFLPNTPVNFGGEFKKYTENIYYNKSRSRSDKGPGETMSTTDAYLFTRTFEYRSNDYYKFRFGIKSDDELTSLRKHYAINTSSQVSIPMYENSYYFYFGLVAGNSALDRLYKDYFANCDSYDEDASFFTFSVEDASQCAKDDGKLTVSFSNIESPYTIEVNDNTGTALYFYEDRNKNVFVTDTVYYHCLSGDGNNGIVDVYTTEIAETDDYMNSGLSTTYTTNLREVTINGFRGRIIESDEFGSRYRKGNVEYSVFLASADGESKSFEISVGLKTPDDVLNIKCISDNFKEYLNYPQIKLWYEIQKGLSDNATQEEKDFLEKCGYITINSDEYVFVEGNNAVDGIVGFVITTDSTFTVVNSDTGETQTIADGFYLNNDGKNYYEYKDGVFRNGNPGSEEPFKVYLWDNNDTYTVYAVYYCHKEEIEKYSFLEIGSYTLEIDMPLDIYITDEDLLYNETIKPLIDEGFCTRTNWWGYMLCEYSGLTEPVYVLSNGNRKTESEISTNDIDSIITRITPKHIWNIKRAFYYENSVYDSPDTNATSIQIGPIGGTPPYKEVLFGAQERVVNSNIGDDEDAESKTYVEVTAPTIAYATDQEIASKISNEVGTTYEAATALSDKNFSISLENVMLPTIGFDMAVGWNTKKTSNRIGYTKNEIGVYDIGFAIATHSSTNGSGYVTSIGNHTEMPGLTSWGANCFYSRQLCINSRKGPCNDDSDKKITNANYFKTPFGNSNISDPDKDRNASYALGQKMLLTRYKDDDLGPKWGPKIHYGVRYEDTYDGTITYDKNNDNKPILNNSNGVVPIFNDVRRGCDFKGVGFAGGTYYNAYGNRYYNTITSRTADIKAIGPHTWHNPDERYFLTVPSIYAPFFFNTVFIVSGSTRPTTEEDTGVTNISVTCVFRINNGITKCVKMGDELTYQFSSITAEIRTSGGKLDVLEEKGSPANERFYRKTGDFPNCDPTVLNYKVKKNDNTYDYPYKKLICGFAGKIEDKPGSGNWIEYNPSDPNNKLNNGFDKDMVYTLPFDLCDCMYDAMPMKAWHWGRNEAATETGSDTPCPFGPFDSFNNSYTSGKSKEVIYREGSEDDGTTDNFIPFKKKTEIYNITCNNDGAETIWLKNSGNTDTFDLEGENYDTLSLTINADINFSADNSSSQRGSVAYTSAIYATIWNRYYMHGGMVARVTVLKEVSGGTFNTVVSQTPFILMHTDVLSNVRKNGQSAARGGGGAWDFGEGIDGCLEKIATKLGVNTGDVILKTNRIIGNSYGLKWEEPFTFNINDVPKENGLKFRVDVGWVFVFSNNFPENFYGALAYKPNIETGLIIFTAPTCVVGILNNKKWDDDTDENGGSEVLKDIVNGGQISFRFGVREGVPSNEDDLEAREIEEQVAIKFLNEVDYNDSGNIRYFYRPKNYVECSVNDPDKTPFYENLSRSYTYYGRVHHSFALPGDDWERDDDFYYWGRYITGENRTRVWTTYTDPETHKADRPWDSNISGKNLPIIDNDAVENSKIKVRPLFSGVYSSVFLTNGADDNDITAANKMYGGISLAELDAKVVEGGRDNGVERIMKYIDANYTKNSGGYIIGIHDPFINGDGSFKLAFDKTHAIWDAVPKDTNLLSVVRVYAADDFEELLKGRYEFEDGEKTSWTSSDPRVGGGGGRGSGATGS